MGYDVRIAPRVVDEDFPGLPGDVIDDLFGDPEDPHDEGKVGVLAQNPTVGKPLSGSLKGMWRLPLCGRYRVIYAILARENIVGILMVGIRREASRSDIYQRLAKVIQEATVEQLLRLEPDQAEAQEPRPRSNRSRVRRR